MDTIQALRSLMDSTETSGEIYNVGSQERISILELAERVKTLTGSKSGFEFIPYEEVYGLGIEDMFHRIPDIDKIDGVVGWKPTRTLEQILSDVVAYVRHAPI
jgi:UDP-glucose 4-epimerase